MDFKNSFSAASLLYDCMIKGKPDFGRIPFTPSKTFVGVRETAPFFPVSSPARAGCDAAQLLSFVQAISCDPFAGVHSVVVLSNGKCVFEASAAGYDTRLPHATFSLCKTVTALAIGILIDDGKLTLDDKVLSFFPEYNHPLIGARMRAITVRHLLTMTSGVVFNEIGAVTEENFLKSFFESAVRFEPGREFAYNSMNSYLLSAIVQKLSGVSLSDFIEARLLDPLGIPDFFWEKSAKGIEKGGWGLYLSPRSMARLGQLFLDGGASDGRQLVSRRWIATMTARQKSVPDAIGPFDYGYHIWVNKEDRSLLLNGMLGQNVWISPEKRLVVALTAGDNCVFQDARSLVAAMHAFTPAVPPRRDTLATRRALRAAALHFGEAGSYTPPSPTEEGRAAETVLPLSALIGEYTVSKNNSGILPLITRLTQNSPSHGIQAIAIDRDPESDALRLSFTEGDKVYTLPVGRYEFAAGEIWVEKEGYLTAAAYSYGMDENRHPFWKVEIRFPELPSSRRLLFRLSEEGLTLSLAESPGTLFVKRLLSIAALSPSGENAIGGLIKGKDPLPFLSKKVRAVFSPHLTLEKKEEKSPQSP